MGVGRHCAAIQVRVLPTSAQTAQRGLGGARDPASQLAGAQGCRPTPTSRARPKQTLPLECECYHRGQASAPHPRISRRVLR
jgi:hypothetical protein